MLSPCGYDLGRIITMTRDDLQWRLTVADDGALAQNGILPILIEWPDGRNPAHRMADSSVRLSRLVLTHPNPAMIANCLDRLGARNAVVLASGVPAIAFILTTDGPVCWRKLVWVSRPARRCIWLTTLAPNIGYSPFQQADHRTAALRFGKPGRGGDDVGG